MIVHENEYLQDAVLRYLKENGIQKKWLAAQLGIPASTLSHWFKGYTIFSDKRIAKIYEILSK